MLNDPHSHGLWDATAPQPPSTLPLSGSRQADVVVIGAGYTGLSAALHLAEKGTCVVVLEANEVGFGGAGRNVGLVNAGLWVMPDALPRILGDVYGERLLTLLGDGPRLVRDVVDRHGIACQLESKGTLHLAVGAKGLRDLETRAAQWQKRSAPVDLLSAAETERRVGSRAYCGSLLDRRAGTLQPLAYARGLAHAAVKAGAAMYTQSPVLTARPTGCRWRVETKHGSVTADWVIVSTNTYSLGAYDFRPCQSVRAEQVHVPYFNMATKPLRSDLLRSILPGREGCWDTKKVLSSFRTDHAGRLVFGSVGALDGLGMRAHSAWAVRSIKRLFPQLGEVSFDHRWFGAIGLTRDALPRFHKFAPNVVGFSGYNGRGISPGSAFGKILAQHVLGHVPEQELPLPVTAPTHQALRRPKEYLYRHGAALMHSLQERF